jgi:hypothetical protein
VQLGKKMHKFGVIESGKSKSGIYPEGIMNIAKIIIGVAVLAAAATAQNFNAYYTKISTGEEWETHSPIGEYADLVVNVGEGKLTFHRSSSYLPLWKTEMGQWYAEEIIPRSGDGPARRPDKNNIYSFVRLIEESSDSIVVHWRYFPEFELGNHAMPVGGNVGFDGVVHEYFYIYPDGKVRREIRQGTKKLDDWEDGANRTIQTLNLESTGIKEIERVEAALSQENAKAVVGTTVKTRGRRIKPTYSWNFDDGLRKRSYESKDMTIEAVTGKSSSVSGPKTVWKKGVSGTALGFDGYYSGVKAEGVRLPEFESLEEGYGFAVEAWVAPGAYSISEWTGIVHQSEWEADVQKLLFQGNDWDHMQVGEKMKKGWFLGIDEFGHLGFSIVIEGELINVTSLVTLPLYEWSHVAVSMIAEGTIHLYVNGMITDFKNVRGAYNAADRDIMIGRNDDAIGYVSKHVVRPYSTFPSPLGFEGLIDEVSIYDKPLFPEGMWESYLLLKPDDVAADMEARILPGMEGESDTFGASYTNLKYHDLWDNMWREAEHPDIVVKFDLMPTSVVFWRGSRSPGWVTETNKWISDQSSELTDWHWNAKTEGAQSCCEHMSDYQGRHSHVRILENSDARVVVHWRYASVDVLYKHPNTCRNEDDWGIWTDEYLIIYPDGVGVRKVDQHGAKDYYHDDEGLAFGFHDTQFLSAAGTRPEDNIYDQAMTIISHKDKVNELDWSESHPDGLFDAQIIWVNLKSDYKVFEVFSPGAKINVWAGGEKTSYSKKFSAWNHYPVTQAPCDGRFCVASDRVAHSALGAVDNINEVGDMLLYGFTNQSAVSLVPLARSWNRPPSIVKPNGVTSKGYDKGQRAYMLASESNELSFTLKASKKSPMVNPWFVVEGWDQMADVTINGDRPAGEKTVRQGLVRDTNGNLQLLVWLHMESNKSTEISLRKKEG